MKNSIKRYIGFLSILAIGMACNEEEFKGSDMIILVPRELPFFSSVKASTDLDLNISLGEEQLVEIMVNDNLQDQIITRVSNNTLVISLEDGAYENATFVVDIQVPTLEKLQLNDNTRATLNFNGDELDLEGNGSSNIYIEGSARLLRTSVHDAASIFGLPLQADTVVTTSRDASLLEITCSRSLEGSVHQAAVVRYSGMPTIRVQTSEDGKVQNAN
ncbi:MAG: DUF2807 domain-containing protein [Cyclobacteriaceae bacterium]|nr:DUF2807 domain-containing protein [Cyclobacteriaceae bacterium HetDA_MAG_MS6]